MARRSRLFLPAAALLAFLCPSGARASAYEDWQAFRARRLFLSQTALLQREEEFRVTGAGRADRREGLRRTVFSGLVEYGASPKAQVSLEAPYASVESPAGGSFGGVGDVTAGILYDLTPVASRDAFAGAFEARLPTGNEGRGLGEGETLWRAGALMSRRRGRTELHLNLFQSWGGDEAGTRLDAAVVLVRGRWRPVLEANGLGAPGNGKFLTPGALYRTWNDVEWGVAFPIGLVGGAPKDGVLLKVSRSFGSARN